MLNRLFSGIFGHFLIRLFIISALSSLLMLYVALYYFNLTANLLAIEQGRTLANSTLAASSDAIFVKDYSAVVDYSLNVMKGTPNIISIIYSKRNGEELIVSGKEWSFKNKTQSYYQMNFHNQPNSKDDFRYKINYEGYGLGFSDKFSYSRPIYISGKDWGVLTLTFSTIDYSSSIKDFYQIITLFAFASIFLSSFLLWISSKRIRSQISSFKDVAELLSDGNMTVRAQENGIGEIGVLGKSINAMSIALTKKSAEIFQLAQIVEQTNDAFVLFNRFGIAIFANDSLERLIGISKSKFIGMSINEFNQFFDSHISEVLNLFYFTSINTRNFDSFDSIFTRLDNSKINVEVRLQPVSSENEDLLCYLVSLTDITKRKQAEANLRISATAFESQEGMFVTDSNGLILRVNNAFTHITGYSFEEVIAQNPSMLSSGRQDKNFYDEMWKAINNDGYWEGELYNRRKNGEIYPQHMTITSVKDTNGMTSNYVATLNDITKSREAEEQITKMAFYDTLTKLPNRRLLMDRLNKAIAATERNGQISALLFLDLDYFKTLNDTLGHHIGDLLLQQVAERLTACVRVGDTVARIGGDEFVVLLENLNEKMVDAASQTEVIGTKILTSLNQPYQLASHKYNNSPSIGATLFHGHNLDIEELLKQADIAMYGAKKSGRNNIRFFDPMMQDVINDRADMERDLRKAIDDKEFLLYYQLQVDSDGHPFGAEALIRWFHPIRGLVTPIDFIPLAEEIGLIFPIGLWVLDAACAQLKAWEKNDLTKDFTVSINVSSRQLHRADFVEQVKLAIQHSGIKPTLLKLELTESMLVDDAESAIIRMCDLQAIGVRFEIDDFGTGYSSLQYLKNLPLYQLKIDQSFIRNIVDDRSDQAIVRTIIVMAKSLNLEVIAEGVETEQQRQFLLNYGCKYFQGYLFSKPLPIQELEALLRKSSLSLL